MTKLRSRSGTSENSHNHHRCCEYRYKCFTILISSAFSRGFKADCPDGSLGKEKILEMYSMILPAGNAKVYTIEMMIGKSMYCSEVHGGAGPGFRPASAHYIAEQV